jgi:sporulation integral membrane protein YlbJ
MISILCGYPLGAKFAISLYEKKEIDFLTCQRLIAIASNPSPLFVIGFIGVTLLESSSLGYILLLSTYISCLLMSFILKPSKQESFHSLFKKSEKNISKNPSLKISNLGEVLKESIHNSVLTCIDIGGFIVFFSVLIGIIKNNTLLDIVLSEISFIIPLNSVLVKSLFLGLIEITNGCNELNSVSMSLDLKIIFISFLLGFSGLSIIAQVSSFICPHHFSIKTYFHNKLIQGFLCSLTSSLLLKTPLYSFSENVFNYAPKNLYTFYDTYLIIILFTFSLFIMKTLFNRIS